MTITRTPIESEAQWLALREQNVGASEVAALLGCHDYLTALGLYARKKGLTPASEPDAGPLRRGRMMERVAVEMIREEFPQWTVERPAAYYADNLLKLGATPDLFVTDATHGDGVIQIKSVEPSIFRRTWFEGDELRPPTWIGVQTITEMMLTGRTWGGVAALVVGYGIDLHIVDVPFIEGVAKRVRSEVAQFWRRIETATPPEPNYGRDNSLLRTLLAQDDGAEIDLSGDNELPEILERRATSSAQAKYHGEVVEACNAMLLHRLGTAALGKFNGGYITAKTVNRKPYQVKATSYRALRVVRKEEDATHAR